ncbi:MAG: hypothetical protein CO129_03060 [Ignavibacteriales bacterium CG_4_9_14_3_um_filter_34_10]|nr:MAG: hypothetical protein CO129_03060 [Ignavibacteriales bacterium CG_4_9_14_3_um_filter_34_10]
MANKESKKTLTQRQKNWIYSGIFFSIVLLLFVLNNINSGPDSGPYPPYYIDSQKKKLNLNDFKGKVVVLNFWATWNADCRKEIRELIKTKDEFRGKDVEIIGINLDAVTQGGITFSEVIPFINNAKINYPVVVGTDKTMNSYGGIKNIPTTIIIDKEGNIYSRIEGLSDQSKLTEQIEEILSGKSVKDKVAAAEFNLRQIN